MKKIAALLMIISLLMLAACGGSKTTGKRVAIPETGNAVTGGVVGVQNTQEPAATNEPTKSAAQVLKEMQSNPQSPSVTTPTGKSGTFYPPVTTTSTGKDALKEKTRALFQKTVYTPNVEADDTAGARYHEKDGDLTNLPDGYNDNDGD